MTVRTTDCSLAWLPNTVVDRRWATWGSLLTGGGKS